MKQHIFILLIAIITHQAFAAFTEHPSRETLRKYPHQSFFPRNDHSDDYAEPADPIIHPAHQFADPSLLDRNEKVGRFEDESEEPHAYHDPSFFPRNFYQMSKCGSCKNSYTNSHADEPMKFKNAYITKSRSDLGVCRQSCKDYGHTRVFDTCWDICFVPSVMDKGYPLPSFVDRRCLKRALKQYGENGCADYVYCRDLCGHDEPCIADC